MPATRIRAAAVQALQLALLVLCLLPLWPLWWAIFSIFGVLTVARGLRNTDSYPGPHWLKWPLAVVSLPLKLAAGLAWTLYAFLTLTIHPFTLLAVEILRLCKRPTWGAGLVQVAPAEHGGQTRYIRFDSIWTALEGRQGLDDQDSDVRLLSAKWLMERAKKGEPLSRRQDLPEEAFLSAAQLKAIQAKARPCFHLDLVYSPLLLLGQGKGFLKHFGSVLAALLQLRNERNADSLLPIIAVSYCWLEAPHPDRDGQQLQLMCQKLQALYGGRGLLGACRDYGFSDMGVFLDWGSIHQKDPTLFKQSETPEGDPGSPRSEAEQAAFEADLKAGRKFYGGKEYEESRSGEEKQAFGRGLKQTMDLWYGHAGITVVLLTKLPKGSDKARSYESRGWTTFERCSAELGKSFNLKVAKWKLVIDAGSEDGDVQRRLPTAPKRMERLLESRQFTNNADKGGVLELYKKTVSAVLGTVEELEFAGMPLVSGDEWCSPAQLAEALNMCTTLQYLGLSGTRLTDKGMKELVGGLDVGALPALTRLTLRAGRFGAEGVTTLCNAFGHGLAPKLKGISFSHAPNGDEHAKALAAAFSSGRMPGSLGHLGLACTDMGDQGATALAAALLKSGVGCRLICSLNHIGLAGQAALLQVQDAKHGASLGLHISVAFGNAPAVLPPFISRAFACGLRYNREKRVG